MCGVVDCSICPLLKMCDVFTVEVVFGALPPSFGFVGQLCRDHLGYFLLVLLEIYQGIDLVYTLLKHLIYELSMLRIFNCYHLINFLIGAIPT